MLPDTYFLIMFPFSNLPNNDYTVCIKRQTQSLSIYKKLPCLLLTHCNYFRIRLFLHLNGEMIGNCFFYKKDDNTKMKKNASFFWFLLGKERGRIVPGRNSITPYSLRLCVSM